MFFLQQYRNGLSVILLFPSFFYFVLRFSLLAFLCSLYFSLFLFFPSAFIYIYRLSFISPSHGNIKRLNNYFIHSLNQKYCCLCKHEENNNISKKRLEIKIGYSLYVFFLLLIYAAREIYLCIILFCFPALWCLCPCLESFSLFLHTSIVSLFPAFCIFPFHAIELLCQNDSFAHFYPPTSSICAVCIPNRDHCHFYQFSARGKASNFQHSKNSSS